MASMKCYKEEGKEFDYYNYGNQKPTTYSNSEYEQSYYEKESCYETKPGMMMGYGASHGHQHGSNPCGPMTGHGKLGYGTGHKTHGTTGYGTGYNTHGATGCGTGHNSHGMGYGSGHNTHSYGNHNMHKPGSNGLGLGLGTGTPLSHVMGFGKTHEGHTGYGMGSSSCNTYKKQHRRRKGMGGYGSGSDCSDSSDDERHC